jgi:YjgF/chorismate_mutase-like, putative endoribonuclease
MSDERLHQALAAHALELPNHCAPRGKFLPWTRSGRTVYLAGQICESNGEVVYEGCVDDSISIDVGIKAAQACALNILFHLRAACGGNLVRVTRCLRVGAFVNAPPGFRHSPAQSQGNESGRDRGGRSTAGSSRRMSQTIRVSRRRGIHKCEFGRHGLGDRDSANGAQEAYKISNERLCRAIVTSPASATAGEARYVYDVFDANRETGERHRSGVDESASKARRSKLMNARRRLSRRSIRSRYSFHVRRGFPRRSEKAFRIPRMLLCSGGRYRAASNSWGTGVSGSRSDQ